MEVSKNLFNMNDLRARVPSDPSSHEIPIVTLLCGNTFQRRECRNRHHDGASILKINLKLTSLWERQSLYFWLYIPITFCHLCIRFFIWGKDTQYFRNIQGLWENISPIFAGIGKKRGLFRKNGQINLPIVSNGGWRFQR